MTPNQFIKIALALDMTAQQVTNMLAEPNDPTPKQIQAEAERMADELEDKASAVPIDEDGEATEENQDKFLTLLGQVDKIRAIVEGL